MVDFLFCLILADPTFVQIFTYLCHCIYLFRFAGNSIQNIKTQKTRTCKYFIYSGLIERHFNLKKDGNGTSGGGGVRSVRHS